eukprot:364944-Chlamydomonas_euryale.AAC.5
MFVAPAKPPRRFLPVAVPPVGAAADPWWALLPDFVPVSALVNDRDPRNGDRADSPALHAATLQAALQDVAEQAPPAPFYQTAGSFRRRLKRGRSPVDEHVHKRAKVASQDQDEFEPFNVA